MTQKMKDEIANSVRDFRLPRYEEIPNVGLYLEQTAKYINEFLDPLPGSALTPSMISNYVKKHLIASPTKKQYNRDQIAYLIFIALAKNVLSLDNIATFINLQEQTYPRQRAYDYFCEELENVLRSIFGLQDVPDPVGVDSTDEKFMLRNTIIALAQKLYLEKCFQVMKEEAEPEKE